LRDRNAAFRSQQHQSRIEGTIRRLQAADFFNLLTGTELLEKTEALLPEHRERLYPPTVTLSLFLKQALEQDRSCQKAVNAWIAQCVAEGLTAPSAGTGAYSKARQRLPTAMVSALTHDVGHMLCERSDRGWRWRGRVVKLTDGTGVSMADTPENQACYPQHYLQAEGVGFPLMYLSGVICLSTGAVLEVATGPYSGKGAGELNTFRRLESLFDAGDVMLADALYCNFFLVARLQALGVDILFEQHGARVTDFRCGKRNGVRDHQACWIKPKKCPTWMSREEYREAPAQLTVREVKVGSRVLVTTLSHRSVCKRELNALYQRRWNIELDFRNIKTTLGLEVLSCKTPQMVEKEVWVYLLAYNLIRLLMAQAAHQSAIHPRQLSFKHTVQIWSEWIARGLVREDGEHDQVLFRAIAQLRVGKRPGRIEPRARKRRPKSYQWLKVPRQRARQQIRLYGYLPNVSA
jgi:hypothetical protein